MWQLQAIPHSVSALFQGHFQDKNELHNHENIHHHLPLLYVHTLLLNQEIYASIHSSER